MTQTEITKRHTDGYNVMRDALSWFEAHEVEKNLGHLPQWVPMAREIRDRDGAHLAALSNADLYRKAFPHGCDASGSKEA